MTLIFFQQYSTMAVILGLMVRVKGRKLLTVYLFGFNPGDPACDDTTIRGTIALADCHMDFFTLHWHLPIHELGVGDVE